MNTELDALATRLYVTIDDLLINHPEWAPERPKIGTAALTTVLSYMANITADDASIMAPKRTYIRFIRGSMPPSSRDRRK